MIEQTEMTPQQKDLKKLLQVLKKNRIYFSNKDHEVYLLVWNLEDNLKNVYNERYE